MLKLTVGCDPEVFLCKNNLPIIACGLVGGTKEKPLQLSENTWVQEDNVTVEFNTKAVEYEQGSLALVEAASKSLVEVQEYLKSKDKGFSVSIKPECYFDHDLLMANPAAIVFGCDPDLSAYTAGSRNALISPGEVGDLRFCGGHIHLGWDTSKVEIPKFALIQGLDAFVTARFVSMSPSYVGLSRVKFYGKPGAYRDKPYGVEYRTPSDQWLASGEYAEAICSFALWAINHQSEFRQMYDAIDFSRVQQGISSLRVPSDLQDQIYTITDKFVKVEAASPPKKKGTTFRTLEQTGMQILGNFMNANRVANERARELMEEDARFVNAPVGLDAHPDF